MKSIPLSTLNSSRLQLLTDRYLQCVSRDKQRAKDRGPALSSGVGGGEGSDDASASGAGSGAAGHGEGGGMGAAVARAAGEAADGLRRAWGSMEAADGFRRAWGSMEAADGLRRRGWGSLEAAEPGDMSRMRSSEGASTSGEGDGAVAGSAASRGVSAGGHCWPTLACILAGGMHVLAAVPHGMPVCISTSSISYLRPHKILFYIQNTPCSSPYHACGPPLTCAPPTPSFQCCYRS